MNAVPPRLIDFHCHLDLYPDQAKMIAECERQGVVTLAVTTTPKAWSRNVELAEGSRNVRVALGLHPQVIAERKSEIAMWERLLPEAKYVGEVGLDAGPRFYKSFEDQTAVFDRVLSACAEAGGKILTIHSVRAVGQVLGHLERRLPPDRGRAVMHWFTGSKSEARRAVDQGCYFSINSQMLIQERHRELVASLPLNRLLTETDGPFTQTAGRPSKPSDVADLISPLASLRGVTAESLRQTLLNNLRLLVTP
ncbi:TatD family hydrolase [Brevundimonas sp. BAL450]|jgi:TatD DNase family protein|uniref:Putative deoxyribonuclease n=1 Tax=Brevundimonas abyssalis TAR-001 TaxID=1391729 RepID=A0A8E0KJS4_9CAUL|nr:MULTISPECIES: Qat anti-phage system TatD family nuclease QatD [Brevundimonas]MBG7616659.1 TatD family hydrolase [Brevundimonas sp. BAL450]GAD58535.1 putative deoxyribonuclease [Brevundimonas abyssalis TAR-001]